jgi:hypothetical protein
LACILNVVILTSVGDAAILAGWSSDGIAALRGRRRHDGLPSVSPTRSGGFACSAVVSPRERMA